MIKLLVVGGKLQGVEVAYLAKKAGYYVIVVDKDHAIPCGSLADECIRVDALDAKKMLKLFKSVDIVIPAIENKEVLHALVAYSKEVNVPLIFDEAAYEISSSKELSNKLFKQLDLPMPGVYPKCQYPVIIKPDDLSGSHGVYKAFSEQEVKQLLPKINHKTVIQEYLEGRSFSLEVIGNGEEFFFPQITEVVVDAEYDCKRIIAPAKLAEEEARQLIEIGRTLSGALKIKGIFDIEVILNKGKQKLLEIDARFPSQTPISVYQSTGINMVELLVNLALGKNVEMKNSKQQVCYYQQIVVDENKGTIQVLGEHIMSECQNLKLVTDFFGADEALTDYPNHRESNYKEETHEWKAILIITAQDESTANSKFQRCIHNIKEQIGNEDWQLIEG